MAPIQDARSDQSGRSSSNRSSGLDHLRRIPCWNGVHDAQNAVTIPWIRATMELKTGADTALVPPNTTTVRV
ncbi:hypothetical protein GCM10009839_08340 [Catenulispora yoronensis]|uniref:Uncharacterized protein n=1 Tax=Catenulispora yoronensis TaxID=450799 RepID=A0ABN2TNY1_9ACTN